MWERYQAASRSRHERGVHRLELENVQFYSVIVLRG